MRVSILWAAYLLARFISVAARDTLSATSALSMSRIAISIGSRRRTLSSFSSMKVANIRAAATPPTTISGRQMEAFKLLSGGVAGTIASVITNPLEVIKTQLQSSGSAGLDPFAVAKEIITRDGFNGFFRGLPPTLFGIIPARSVYFYSYECCKSALGPYFTEASPANALISGLTAGICSNTLTNPIWMVRTRMQILPGAGQKTYSGYGDAIHSIWKQEGIAGFYKGIVASYWGCVEGALQFIVYEQIKTRLLEKENKRRLSLNLPETDQLSRVSYFWAAAFAKAVASVGTYPHEVARTRLREQARSGVFRYSGMWQTLALIGKEEGRAGLYSGLGIHLVKVVPNSALMFLTYEVVNAWLSKITVSDGK